MIVVLGSVTVAEGRVDDALRLSLEHVRRSRTEPGCIEHGVHLDAENPNRLVFVEKWADAPALSKHFEVPASLGFVADLTGLAVGPPTIEIYEASTARV